MFSGDNDGTAEVTTQSKEELREAKKRGKEIKEYMSAKEKKFKRFFSEELSLEEQAVAWKVYKKWDLY